MQYWLRELARVVTDVPLHRGLDGRWHPQLAFTDDLEDPDKLVSKNQRYFPLDNCNVCGSTAWIGLISHDGERLEGSRKHIIDLYFSHSKAEDVRLVYPLNDGDSIPPKLSGSLKSFCGKCRRLMSEGVHCCACGHDQLIRVAVVKPEVLANGKYRAPCPYCGGDHANHLMVGMRSATMLSTCISTLTTSKDCTDKKILTFSDNVQDTSQRAGFFGGRTWAATFRGHLSQYFASLGVDEVSYRTFLDGFPQYLAARLPDWRDQLAELIPQDLKWLNDWRKLKGDDAPIPSDRTMKAFFARLRWQIALEFGCCQDLGRTLNRTCVAKLVSEIPGKDDSVWRNIADYVSNQTETLRIFAFSPEKIRDCFEILATWMIRNGAFEDGDSVLRVGILSRGKMAALNTMENNGIPIYKTKRSENIIVPGMTQDKTLARLAILDSLSLGHPLADKLKEAGFCLDENSLALLFESFDKASLVRSFNYHGKLTFWYLPIESLKIIRHPEADSSEAKLNPFRKQYLEGEIHRINPAEHTGLLNREEREELENRFKSASSRRWDPNLISATPTLEMGVDIGDLSSVLLCSVPPNQSKFIQRIGRSGRRNGSALNITVAAAKPHDLYFFREPAEMISGNVTTPGVFLDASAILERQYLGFALSEWMLSSGNPTLPDTIGRMFIAIDNGEADVFPKNFFSWYDESKDDLIQRFQRRLNNFNQVHHATTLALLTYAYSDVFGKKGVCGRMEEAVAATRTSLKNYEQKQRDLMKLRKEIVKDPGLTDALRDERLESLDVEIKSYRTFISNLKKQSVMGWLCDCVGLLPNYAFPEPGVVLQSILWRREVKTDPPKYEKIEISRPASSGLTELVPGSTFYTHGHHMLIDQVDMQRYSEEEIATCQWRLCPECDHIEMIKSVTPHKCPVCGADWSNNGQVRNLLPVRQFVTVRPDKETLNDDKADNRESQRYECRKFFEKDILSGGVQSFLCEGEGTPFAFEYVPHLILREVNFGFRTIPKEGEEAVVVNGDPLTGLGFRVCRECNKAVPEMGLLPSKIQHVKTCKTLLAPRDENDNLPEDVKAPVNVSFYREYHTEALRIFAPFLGEDNDTRVMSFMAAIQLGLKEYFRGEVDHLQMEVQSLPLPGKSVRQHFLILYDAVPGGTGYVRQFAEGDRPKLLFDIFEKALSKLKNCTCSSDPTKDGCYNCLYRYRNQNGRDALSRREAIKILEELLPQRKTVKRQKTSAGIGVSTAMLVESELEKQFILRLASMTESLGGKFEDATVRGYVKGWRIRLSGAFKLGAEQVNRDWEIVPQKDLGPDDGVLVKSRPDFMFYPIGADVSKKVRPVAVFLDGWEYHKDIVGDDIVKRMALINAGYNVWSLSWDDVAQIVPGKMESPPVPIWREHLAEGTARTELGKKFYGDNGERAQAWHDCFNRLPQEIDRFVAYLQASDDELFRRHASFEMALMMVVGMERKEPMIKRHLPSAYSAFLDGGISAQIKEPLFETGLVLRSDKSAWGALRPSVAALLDDRVPIQKDAWRSFFAFLTYFQFLGHDFISFTMKSKDDPFWMNLVSVHSSMSTGGDLEWDDAFAMVDGDMFCIAVLKAMRAEGLPAPQMFEDVFDAEGAVFASPWMQWPDKKLMALPPDDIADIKLIEPWCAIPLDVGASPEAFVKSFKEAYNG
jgi:DEAD/DEAH box helicase domain-containing protein